MLGNIITDTRKTWVISDTHWCDPKVAEKWDRPAAFNDMMIRRWNSVVEPDDLVIHLGDMITSRGYEDMALYNRMLLQIKKLNGNKVLIRGNNDFYNNNFYNDLGFKVINDYGLWSNFIFIHDPADAIPLAYESEWHFCLAGHHHTIFGHDPVLALGDKVWYNCSVEVHDYYPKRLSEVIAELIPN